MFISYLKKNCEKIISTFTAILVASLTKEFVNTTEVLKEITNGEIEGLTIIIWAIQIIAIMVISLSVEFIIKRFKIQKMRKEIRFKKNFPFKHCSKIDKEKELDDKITFLEGCISKIKDLSNKDTDNKLHLLKQLAICLNEFLLIITNLIYYNEQCITSPNEHPIDSKFSICDIKYYFKNVVANYDLLKEEVDKLKKSPPLETHQNNEIKHIDKIIDFINSGIIDAKTLLEQLQGV